MSRPSVDDLKVQVHGHTSAGRYAPKADRQTERARWFVRLRAAMYARHKNERVTADEAVRLMEETPALARPGSVHPNAMGPFFSTWDAAEPVMVGEGEDQVQLTRTSPRDGNLLKVWRIV